MPTNYTPSQVYDKYVALQKQLATNITSKGITASQTELYDSLIDKVAQIENLKGEERTLENFTNVLSEPKSIVQLEYPEPKNLFDKSTLIADAYIVEFTQTTNGFTFKTASTTRTMNVTSNIYLLAGTYYCSGTVTCSDTSYKGGWGVYDKENQKYIINASSRGIINDKFTVTESKTYQLSFFAPYVAPVGVTMTFENVQLEKGSTATPYEPYPAPKTLNAKLGSKNLWQTTNTTFPAALSYDSATQTYTMDAGTAGYKFVAHTLTNPIPVGTTVTISIMFQSGKGKSIAIGGYHRTGGISWQGYINIPSNTDMTGQTLTSTFTTTETVEEFMIFHNTGDNIEEPVVFKVQYELGSVATTYTPYISDFSTVNVTRCGKNILEYPYVETTLTRNGLTFTDNKDGTITVNGTATADTQFRLQDTVVYPNNPNPFNSLIGRKVYISGSPEGSSKDTYAIQWISPGVYGNGVLTVTKSSYYRFAIFVKSGITVNDLTFKPQIELGTTATPYEPYQGQTYTPTTTGEVTGITNLYPTTTLLTDNAGVVFEQVTGQTYKEILPSTDKNGITKVYQPSVDSSIDSNITSDNIKQGVSILGVTGDYICNYTYDETTKELVLLL